MSNNGAHGKALKMLIVVDIVANLIYYPGSSELIKLSEVQEICILNVNPSSRHASTEPLVGATAPGTDHGCSVPHITTTTDLQS